jgi:hypothetical protein
MNEELFILLGEWWWAEVASRQSRTPWSGRRCRSDSCECAASLCWKENTVDICYISIITTMCYINL